jgi:hypothetical protein
MATHIYTEVELRRLKGQSVKDIWHAMIGKPPGIKNTTGLKTTEDVLQAILTAQDDPCFLSTVHVRPPKPSVYEDLKEKEMAPKKKPGPVPKAKPTPPPLPLPTASPKIRAIETMDPPLSVSTVVRISVRKLYVEGEWYYLDAKTQTVYQCVENRPGERLGTWTPETRSITYED